MFGQDFGNYRMGKKDILMAFYTESSRFGVNLILQGCQFSHTGKQSLDLGRQPLSKCFELGMPFQRFPKVYLYKYFYQERTPKWDVGVSRCRKIATHVVLGIRLCDEHYNKAVTVFGESRRKSEGHHKEG